MTKKSTDTRVPATVKPTRINFERMDIARIQVVLSTGSLEALSEAEQQYYSLMELVRGLRARMRFQNGKIVTKAGVIRLLKGAPYYLSDWMARQVYADALNFFYVQDNVRPEAFGKYKVD